MATEDLRIPQSQKPAIRLVAEAEASQIEAILSAFRELPPSMFLRSSAEFLASKVSLTEADALRLLVMVSSLFDLQEQPGIAADDLRSEILSAAAADEDLDLTPERRQQLDWFLRDSLSLSDSLGVALKAWSVARDSANTYCYSRTLTDLRPVFAAKSTEPKAFVVLHNLKLAYHRGEDLREIFISLSAGDLDKLVRDLERAREKEAKLKNSVADLGLRVLGGSNDG